MTSTHPADLDLIKQSLEEQYELHTNQLAELTGAGGDSDSGSDPYTRVVLITLSRRSLSEVAHALRRMAQGTYGVCEHCGRSIPAERLETLPHTRFCASCQTARR